MKQLNRQPGLREWAVRNAPVLIILFLGLLRLFLTGDRDIVARNNPHDQFWYINTALNLFSGGSYSQMTMANLPVYAGWLYSGFLLGIPGHLMIDLALVLASTWLSFQVSAVLKNPVYGIILLVLLLFHPYALILFDQSLAEVLLTVLTIATSAAFLQLWRAIHAEDAELRDYLVLTVLTALLFGLTYYVRKEGFLILVPLGLLGLVSAVDRKNWWTRDGLLRRVVPLIAAPVAAVVLVGLALSTYNQLRWGGFYKYELEAPGYVSAMNAVLSIKPEAPTPRQISVTRKTLEQAFTLSPTAHELKAYFDGPGRGWEIWTEQSTGIKGEIGDGWFYWAFRDAAASAGWHANPSLAETKYRQMATEISQALASQPERSRAVFLPFVDPDYGKWSPLVPQATLTMLSIIAFPDQGRPESFVLEETATSSQRHDFTKIVGRRNEPQNQTIQGWIIAPQGSQFGYQAEGGVPNLKMTLSGATRPDVPGGFPFLLQVPPTEKISGLVMVLADGTVETWPLNSLQLGRVSVHTTRPEFSVGIDVLNIGRTETGRADRYLAMITQVWSWAGLLLALAIAIHFVGFLLQSALRFDVRSWIVVLAIGEVVARAVLFGVLDSSSWFGAAYRYLFPVSPLFLLAGILSLSVVYEMVMAGRGKKAEV